MDKISGIDTYNSATGLPRATEWRLEERIRKIESWVAAVDLLEYDGLKAGGMESHMSLLQSQNGKENGTKENHRLRQTITSNKYGIECYY